MDNHKKLTYKQGNTSADILRYIKAIALPIGTFLLALFCISRLQGLGTTLVAPLTAIMWAAGAVCAIILPSHRSQVLTETHVTIGCYLIALIIIQEVASLIGGVSSEMMMSAFNQAVPLTSGTTMSGFLSTLLLITAIMTPIGFLGLQGKRIYSFRRNTNKDKTIDQLRNIRSNGGHME